MIRHEPLEKLTYAVARADGAYGRRLLEDNRKSVLRVIVRPVSDVPRIDPLVVCAELRGPRFSRKHNARNLIESKGRITPSRRDGKPHALTHDLEMLIGDADVRPLRRRTRRELWGEQLAAVC